MTSDPIKGARPEQPVAKHPSVDTINDVFTFKMNRFVMINEREGQRWSKEDFDLSLNEWRALALIKANAPVRAVDIAEQMLMDKSQFSRLVKVLTAKHMIKRNADGHDARATVLSLTATGMTLYDEMLAEVVQQNEMVLAPLSGEEVARFLDMLNRLTEHSLALLRSPVTSGH